MKQSLIKLCLFNSLIIFSLGVIAQSDSLKIDSLKRILVTEKDDTNKVNTLNMLSDILGDNGDYESGYKYADKSLPLAEKIKFRYGIGYAHYLMGSYLAVQTQIEKYPDAMRHLMTAMSILQESGNKEAVGNCYTSLATVYGMMDDFPEEINNYYKALKIFEESGDEKDVIYVHLQLGFIYSHYHNDGEAQKILNSLLVSSQHSKNLFDIAWIDISIGTVLISQHHYAEALEKFFSALKIFKDSSSVVNEWGAPVAMAKIGEVYEKEGDSALSAHNKILSQNKYEEAASMYAQSLSSEEAIKGNMGTGTSLKELGTIYIKTRNLKAARNYLKKALLVNEKNHWSSELPEVYLGLSTLDSLEGNFKASDENLREYIKIHDSLISGGAEKKIIQSQMQYDFDKKESISKAEQDKKDEEAKRVRNQQLFTILVLGVVILSVIIIALIQFRNNKQKQKANLLLERQKQKVESTLTELKSTQSQLIQSEKMASLGELTAGIAHEIQNPLNFVNNFSEVSNELIGEMVEEVDKGNTAEVKAIAEDIKQNLEKINHHGKRADAIVKGMLQHSRSSVGVKELTDINSLADEYLRLSYHGLRAKDKSFNATMKTDFDASIGKINIVPQDIGRVLLNLYNNAFYAVNEKIKTSDENYQPEVEIETRKEGNRISITVCDNGNGIPQKVIDKIFQPFFTTKPTGQGTGLGLSLSYDVVKAHGGEIKVNTKEGEGTEFIIKLPIL